jgi:hypothetical protein
MKICIFIVIALFCNSCQINAADYKEDITERFERVSKELKSEEQKLIEISPEEGRVKLRNAFAAWRQWVRLYLDSKYSGAKDKGSITPYLRIDENSDLYERQITWLKSIKKN